MLGVRDHAATDRGSRGAIGAAVALCLFVALTYCGAYAWARATHRLVHYDGGCTGCDRVRAPASYYGTGRTPLELVFAPPAWAEGKLHSFPFWL